MKRIFTSLIISCLLLFASSLTAQTPHPWELGFNAGAAWQQSDVKMKKLGAGLGFTLGQMYCQTETSPLDWGWRFRFLSANTYGQENKRHYGIQNNLVLNGGLNDSLNYYSSPGYVYHNYKTTLSELSLEVLIGLNRMRERTKVYPYIFGGVGITKGIAKIDQLDAGNQMYDYTLLDSANAGSQLGSLLDNDYETLADGNTSPRWKFMPSLGVGLGFQITKGFSMGLEHKVTWARNDVLDGQQWSTTNAATGNNDRYHYSSVWLKFSFGRTARPANTTNTNVNNYTENNTVVATPQKPRITWTNPSSGSATVTSQTFNLTARITNINSVSDISFTSNGAPVTNFTYNAGSQMFSAPVMLINGTNNYTITATNTVGVETAAATVIYNTPAPPQALAPAVTITNPNVNPYTTRDAVINVMGTVTNITDRSQMQITVNGAANNSFVYSASTKAFSVSTALTLGANTFVISAANAGGSDTKSTIVIYQQDAAAFSGPAPVVTITNPASNPFNSPVNSAAVSATVMNVTSSSQITAALNGVNVPFSFNAGTHQLNLTASLITGANNVTISATNPNGSNSQSRTIIYTPVVSPKPVVTITNPGVNPYTSPVSPLAVNATVLNVTAIGQISVSLNGSTLPTAALSFNAATGSLSFNVNLINGANSVQVTASNVAGSDSKTTTIIYTQPAAIPAPVVTITNPAANPFTTSLNTVPVNAMVINVAASSQITVKLNGVSVPFNFNPATHIVDLNASLMAGVNTVMVSATNASGSDSKSTTIIYSQPVSVPAPVVTITNPNVNPFNTSISTATVNATVLNVTSASQISLSFNGASSSAFSFNAATHQLVFNAALISGANTVAIMATNTGGSDSKSTTIIYTPPPPMLPPVVTITSPNVNPLITDQLTYTVKATVLNVTGASQIQVMLNGTATTAFTYSAATKQLVFNATLHSGANPVTITATNAAGSDSKSVTIKVVATATGTGADTTGTGGKPGKPLKGLPGSSGSVTFGGTGTTTTATGPSITLVTPAGTSVTTTDALYTVAATVDVMNQSFITVKINGTATTSFSFNRAAKALTIPLTLSSGITTVTIEASGSSGTNSKTVTITKP